MTKLTTDHLRQACEWAIKNRGARQRTQIGDSEESREYNQEFWDCGTACCLHGAAHIIATGKPLNTSEGWLLSYEDLGRDAGETIRDLLSDSETTPEDILEVIEEYSQKNEPLQ